MNYNRLIVIWVFCTLTGASLKSQVYTEQIERAFRASSSTTVEVQNKYGIVHVETWKKDSVKISIDFRVEANSQEKLDNVKNTIMFDFSPSKYKIQAKTTFTKARGLITEFVDAFVPSTQVVIDYTVFIPEKSPLIIKNKFGNIYLDELTGNVDIELSNGDLTAEKLTGKTNLKLSSGNSEIEELKNGTIQIAYGDLVIKKAQNLNLETRSSKVKIEQANMLNIKSSRDKYTISQADELTCEGSITTLKLDNLENEINCSLKYGGVSIDNVRKTFQFINLESEYADIDLIFEHGSAYNLDVTHHQDVDMILPLQLARIETKNLDADEKLMLTYGTIGNASVNSPKLKITALKKCAVSIIHK